MFKKYLVSMLIVALLLPNVVFCDSDFTETISINEQNITLYYDVNEYINTIKKDVFISQEEKQMLINDAVITMSRKNRSQIEYIYGTIRGKVLNVDYNYKPYPYFYVKLEKFVGNPSPNSIVSINYANIHREYNGISKQFSGTLYYNLVAGNEIYWDVNGDFYHNGSTSISGGGSVNIKGVATANFSVSTTSSHYKYIHQDGRYYSSGMLK